MADQLDLPGGSNHAAGLNETMSDSANADTRLVVGEADVGKRLDRFLSSAIDDLSRERIKALILDGQVRIDDRQVKEPSHKVRLDAVATLSIPALDEAGIEGEHIALNIAFEDPHLIVIDKPAGLVTHPAPGNQSGTLVNALIAHCGADLSGIGGVKRPGIVHRLDKDTSGLLVVAKSDAAHQGLSEQFQAHGRDGRLKREYVALVWGHFERPAGQVDAPLARSQANRRKMAIAKAETGRHAVTHYRLEKTYALEAGGSVSRVRLMLETGRTHQIRVHMASIGHPLLGDSLYGAGFRASESLLPEKARDALQVLGRQALHATTLGFEHPITEQPMYFESQLPSDIVAVECSLCAS